MAVKKTTTKTATKSSNKVANVNCNNSKDDSHYCCKCGEMKSRSSFYESESVINEATGLMHICKPCCEDLFKNIYRQLKKMDEFEEVNSDTITFTILTEKAIKLTCRYLDLQFNHDAYDQLENHINTKKGKNSKVNSIFGIYKSKLTSKTGKQCSVTNTTYEFSDEIREEKNIEEINSVNKITIHESDLHDMEMFWGKGMLRDDYEFLERELSDWKTTHKCDNKSELVLLKEICLKELDIRKAREDGKDVGKLQDGLQDLMKTASVDPAKANVASAGKSADTYGAWIKETETTTPAEWHKQQEKYKDMDGLLTYLTNYVKRPILNFLSGTRNFELVGEKFSGILDDEEENNGGDE